MSTQKAQSKKNPLARLDTQLVSRCTCGHSVAHHSKWSGDCMASAQGVECKCKRYKAATLRAHYKAIIARLSKSDKRAMVVSIIASTASTGDTGARRFVLARDWRGASLLSDSASHMSDTYGVSGDELLHLLGFDWAKLGM